MTQYDKYTLYFLLSEEDATKNSVKNEDQINYTRVAK